MIAYLIVVAYICAVPFVRSEMNSVIKSEREKRSEAGIAFFFSVQRAYSEKASFFGSRIEK